jgi:hypothetical protein
MSDYEYVVKEGDTLQVLSEAFYRNSEHSQYLVKFNHLKTDSISVNQKLKMPRILLAGSETIESLQRRVEMTHIWGMAQVDHLHGMDMVKQLITMAYGAGN